VNFKTLSLSLSLSLSVSYSHSHTHTHTLSLSLTHTHTLSNIYRHTDTNIDSFFFCKGFGVCGIGFLGDDPPQIH
jgi:hypothetical protein